MLVVETATTVSSSRNECIDKSYAVAQPYWSHHTVFLSRLAKSHRFVCNMYKIYLQEEKKKKNDQNNVTCTSH